MIASMLTGLFFAAAVLAGCAIFATMNRYGAKALALGGELAAGAPARGFSYNVIEHRTLRGDINVVVLPIRKASYRVAAPEGLRAAA